MGKHLITDMPAWMPDLWNAYGFRWGGDYINRPDAMHYEFMGSVADAARLTQVARQNRLGEIRVPPKPKPPEPPEPPKPKVEKMYFLIQGDESDREFLTDGLTKRYMSKRDEANRWVVAIRGNGGTCVTDSNNEAKVWPQEWVDSIPEVKAPQDA
jgi:hypothetical protein